MAASTPAPVRRSCRPHRCRRRGEVVADLEDGYIWALAVDAKGENVYAATGPRGRVYRLGPDGKASVFYQTKHEHVLCLALGADGNLYAGTDRGGLVYRIDSRGKGFVVFSAPQSDVRSIAVAADGSVYAGTSSPAKRRGPGSLTAGGGSSGSSLSGRPAPGWR
jgi:sugar lactone lactonase YvrE